MEKGYDLDVCAGFQLVPFLYGESRDFANRMTIAMLLGCYPRENYARADASLQLQSHNDAVAVAVVVEGRTTTPYLVLIPAL